MDATVCIPCQKISNNNYNDEDDEDYVGKNKVPTYLRTLTFKI